MFPGRPFSIWMEGSEFAAQFTLPHRVVVTLARKLSAPGRSRPQHLPDCNRRAGSSGGGQRGEHARPHRASTSNRPAEMRALCVIPRDEIERLGVADLDSVTQSAGPREHLARQWRGKAPRWTSGKTRSICEALGVGRDAGARGRPACGDIVGGWRARASRFPGLYSPAAAIDRIELLPASAAGNYGGGATAGIINMVLRSDCPDGRVAASYGNSFQSDTLNHSVFVSHCLNAFDGRTKLAFSANEAEYSSLQAGERDFAIRGRGGDSEEQSALLHGRCHSAGGGGKPMFTPRMGAALAEKERRPS